MRPGVSQWERAETSLLHILCLITVYALPYKHTLKKKAELSPLLSMCYPIQTPAHLITFEKTGVD